MSNEVTPPETEVTLSPSEREITYFYLRVSSRQQDLEGNIEFQLAVLAHEASIFAFTARRFYADRGVSLWEGNPNRPVGRQEALEALKSDVENDHSTNKSVWATEVSRFARNRQKGREFYQWAQKNNVRIRIYQEEYGPSEADEMRWYEACLRAEEEVANLSYRAIQQHENSDNSGRRKWGFDFGPEGWFIKPQHGQLVAELFQMARKGATVTELAEKLQVSGLYEHRSPTAQRFRNKVREILHDPEFAGYEVFHGDLNHPHYIRLEPSTTVPVVSRDVFFDVQLLLPKLRRDSRLEFFLADRVICGVCRKKLIIAETNFYWISRSYDRPKFVRRAYVCPEGPCRPSQIYNADDLHVAAKHLLLRWEHVRNDKGLYERWENANPTEKQAIIKQTISFRRLLVANAGGLENPRWAENSR